MTEPANTNFETPKDSPLKQIVAGLLSIAGLGVIWFACQSVAAHLSPIAYQTLMDAHGHAIVGIPFAAGLAVTVVGTCRTIDGPINLDFMGLNIKGGGGIVVLWIATFLAIVLAIRVLW